MKHHCTSSSDRISELPSNIMDNILIMLPLREIVRTSILSRNWRFQWTTVPQLIFDDSMRVSQSMKKRNRYTIKKVLGILLLHQGPLLKFTLDMTSWPKSSKMDKIIHFLSRNGIQNLTLRMRDDVCPQLTSSIFSCVELKHLSLHSCEFQPLTLVGFHKLISVELLYIDLDPTVSIPCGPILESLKLISRSYIDCFSVDAPNLKSLYFEGCVFSSCSICAPLLKILSLNDDDFRFNLKDGEFDLFRLLRSLPLLENLHLSPKFRWLLARGDSQNEHPTVLNSIKRLELIFVNLATYDEYRSTRRLLRSSPNLQNLKIELYIEDRFEPNEEKYIADFSLMNLREVDVTIEYECSSAKLNSNFIEYLLAVSPKLETLYIKPFDKLDDKGYNSLMELASLRRASPKTEIVFLDPDIDQGEL